MKIKLISPPKTKILGIKVLDRVMHFDPRGFLVETMRKDDKEIDGQNFAMSYMSLTLPGIARDETQWHHHRKQVDRFLCVKGRIALALYDARENSKTVGLLEVLDLWGAEDKDLFLAKKTDEKRDKLTYLVTVPEGVFHCYKNIGEEECLLANYPTKLYDPNDEGRTPFLDISLKSLSGKPFSWELLQT